MSFSEVSLSSTDDPEGSQMTLRRAESRRFFLEALRRLRTPKRRRELTSERG